MSKKEVVGRTSELGTHTHFGNYSEPGFGFNVVCASNFVEGWPCACILPRQDHAEHPWSTHAAASFRTMTCHCQPAPCPLCTGPPCLPADLFWSFQVSSYGKGALYSIAETGARESPEFLSLRPRGLCIPNLRQNTPQGVTKLRAKTEYNRDGL